MPAEFQYDVFLSHSAKDKAVARPLAERLRKDGLKVWLVPPEPSGVAGFDEWNAFGSDWAQLACSAVASARRRKAGTFRFRDPLNKIARFIPLA